MDWLKNHQLSFESTYSCPPANAGVRATRNVRILLLCLFVFIFGHVPISHAVSQDEAQPMALIVLGAGGTEEYAEDFRKAGSAWKNLFPADSVVLIDGTYSEDSEQELHQFDSASNQTSDLQPPNTKHREKLLATIRAMQLDSRNLGTEKSAEEKNTNDAEVRWLILIGHGTHDRTGTKFNLKGADVDAATIADALNESSKRWVIVNAFSSSGPFINILSAPNRVVLTATKSGSEQNYSRFAIELGKSIGDPASDLNHDGLITVLETFLVASSNVTKFYSDNKRLATEQALLDDNGDKRGTPASFYRGLKAVKAPADGASMDGELARRITLNSLQLEKSRSKESLAQARLIEEQIAELKTKKGTMDAVTYRKQLELLLLEMAAALGVNAY